MIKLFVQLIYALGIKCRIFLFYYLISYADKYRLLQDASFLFEKPSEIFNWHFHEKLWKAKDNN